MMYQLILLLGLANLATGTSTKDARTVVPCQENKVENHPAIRFAYQGHIVIYNMRLILQSFANEYMKIFSSDLRLLRHMFFHVRKRD